LVLALIGIFRKLCIVIPDIKLALLPVGHNTWTDLFVWKIVRTAFTIHFIKSNLPDPAVPVVTILSGSKSSLLLINRCKVLKAML